MGSPHGFDAGQEFDELANVIDRGSGAVTAAQRQANAQFNLGLNGTAAAMTLGTVKASSVVTVDANKDVSTFRNMVVTNLDAGSSGVAGTVDVFPATAAKGKIIISATDAGGDFNTTVTNAAMGQAVTVTIPDGGSATDTFATLKAANAFAAAITTTDGVASGTARKIGGQVKEGISTTDTVTAVASNNTFVTFATTYSVPANTIKAGTRVKVKAHVSVNDASGTDTLTCNLRIDGTSLIATTAVDPTSTSDHHILEFNLVGRAAPGAAAALVGYGRWATNTGGTAAQNTAILASTNKATNGALVIDAQAKWSSNTANTSARLESFEVEIVG